VLIGSVPDRARLHAYYDTDEKRAFFEECERRGEPHMGRWWSGDEIVQVAGPFGFHARIVSQPEALYTAYYRFDAILERHR
jgi:hypothetical protein